MKGAVERARAWAFAPQPLLRLELVRILAPLAILGFLSSRLAHASEWLGYAGFHPLLAHDWRQPVALPPASPATAWTIAVLLVLAGLLLSAGALTRVAAGAFAFLLGYVALADRLATFTVTKLGTVIAVALFFSPCGARWSVDALRRRRRGPPPVLVTGGAVRFFQVLLAVFYAASGICKARGDWLHNPAVIWTHLHDSYQTSIAYAAGRLMPVWGWTVLQGTTLAYETLAPLWFAFAPTRRVALAYGVAMHLAIGLMFGPVVWFSLLMIALLVASFGPLPRSTMGRGVAPADGSPPRSGPAAGSRASGVTPARSGGAAPAAGRPGA